MLVFEFTTIMSFIVLWVLWPAYRVVLARSESYFYNFDEVHHSDFGWAIIAHGLLMPITWLAWCEVIFGIILVIDDTVGHWRSARGKPEEWVLEWTFGSLINWAYKILRKRNG